MVAEGAAANGPIALAEVQESRADEARAVTSHADGVDMVAT